MKKFLAAIAVALLVSCGGESNDELKPEGDRCEIDNSICEHVAARRGFYGQWFALRNCSWDYGVCIGKLGETNCADWCAAEAWMPSECMYGCEAYGPPQTMTSTTGE